MRDPSGDQAGAQVCELSGRLSQLDCSPDALAPGLPGFQPQLGIYIPCPAVQDCQDVLLLLAVRSSKHGLRAVLVLLLTSCSGV